MGYYNELCYKGTVLYNFVLQVNEGVVVCPGNKSACSTGNTCCLTATGGYGCCPLPNVSTF